jgi:hypothetical protein
LGPLGEAGPPHQKHDASRGSSALTSENASLAKFAENPSLLKKSASDLRGVRASRSSM